MIRSINIAYAGVPLFDKPEEYDRILPYNRINFFDVPWTASSPGFGLVLVTGEQLESIKRNVSETNGKGVLELSCIDEDGKKNEDLSVRLNDIYIVKSSPIWSFGSTRYKEESAVPDKDYGLYELELQDERSYLLMRILDKAMRPALFNILSDKSSDSSRQFIKSTVKPPDHYPYPGTAYTLQELFDLIFQSLELSPISLSSIGEAASSIPVDLDLVGIPSLIAADLLAYWCLNPFLMRYDPSEEDRNLRFGVCPLSNPSRMDTLLQGKLMFRMFGASSERYPYIFEPKYHYIFDRKRNMNEIRVDRESDTLNELYYIAVKENPLSPPSSSGVLPIFNRIGYGMTEGSLNRSMNHSSSGRMFHGVYHGFHGDFLDIGVPFSLVSFSWGNGSPMTEVHTSYSDPIKHILESRYGRVMKNTPLRMEREGDLSYHPKGGNTSSLEYFQVVSIREDYLVCVKYDIRNDFPSGNDFHLVAKPWELRKTPFHNQIIRYKSYVYLGNEAIERVVTDTTTGAQETQKINPPWVPGRSVILAAYIGNTGVEGCIWEEISIRNWGFETVEES